MATQSSAHPIPKKDLEYHLKKVDEHLESIDRGHFAERENIYSLLKGVGSNNANVISLEVSNAINAIRDGFSLFYAMHAILEDKVKSVNSDVSENEKNSFLNAYSIFAGSSFISYKLNLQLGEATPIQLDKESLEFNFDLSKDNTLNSVLARYFGILNSAKRHEVLKEGIDVVKSSVEFYNHLREQSSKRKTEYSPKLVDLVKDSEFNVAEEFSFKGYELTHHEKSKTKVEFVSILPHQVAGNVLAKQEMIRDMDRITLFDLKEKKNPIIEVGGLSWSVLYDGFPGTGKSSLFRMGLTRLKQRAEQASEYWTRKNISNLKWSEIVIDQGIKNKYYGETSANLLAKLEPSKRADGIYIITTDDIDLLVGDRDSESGGSDKDILNVLMQYADGIHTVILGNVQWWAATNDATAMDPALRQRFLARYEVDGPREWYDFADITHDKLKTWIKLGIVNLPMGDSYTPYEMRKNESEKGKLSKGEKSVLSKIGEKFSSKKQITLRDIGELCKEFKDKNERFTGRAVHAVSEAIKKRINDYEIPEVWYSNPDLFFSQPYDRKVEMLRELCVKVDGNVLIEEFERYAKSEMRYADDKLESDVQKVIHRNRVIGEVTKREGEKNARH